MTSVSKTGFARFDFFPSGQKRLKLKQQRQQQNEVAGLVLHLVVVAHRGGSCYLRNPGDPVQVGAVLILAALGVVAVLVLARVALVPLGLAVGAIHLSISFDFGLRVVFQSKTVGNERRRRQQKLGPIKQRPGFENDKKLVSRFREDR